MAEYKPISSSIIPPTAAPTTPPDSSLFSQRSRRQFGLFMGGAAFFALSAAITRRSLVRKYKSLLPKFYTPSNHVPEFEGSMEALEALSVATVNVASGTVMFSGGLLWAFDISTFDDMQQRYRAKMGLLVQETNPEDEKQMEEWVTSMMVRLNIDPKEYMDKKDENALGETEEQADDVSMDCKVTLRKYVLVSRPPKWAQQGDRVVVHSPVQDITNESVIPVRRFNGDDENSVCFMPTQDIEKDGSIAQINAMVSSTATRIDAHGVALSETDSDFEYRPGDQFWLFIAADRTGYENEVPVINLRTMATGRVPITHVCWFPRMHGPGNEVWTFGSSIRKLKLKHAGKNQFTFWTWGICQYLDGKPVTTKEIQVPERNISTDAQRWLSSADSRPLFFQILKIKTQDHHQIHSPLSLSPQSFSECFKSLFPAPAPIFKILDKAFWISIMDPASKETPTLLRSSLIHSQRTLSSPDRRKYRRTEVDVDARGDSGSSDKTATSSTISFSPTMGNDDTRSYSNDLSELISNQDGEGIEAAVCHLDIYRRQVAKVLDQNRNIERPVLSAAHPLLRNDPTILSEGHQINKNMPTIEFLTSERNHNAELCDRGKDDCEWSLQFISKHYHPDPRKCHTTKSMSDHEHCISAKRAYPGAAGPCLLMEGPREHHCCLWKSEDTNDWSAHVKKEFDMVKIAEAKKWDAPIFDESRNVKEEDWCPIGTQEFIKDEFC
ncbi:hypothetical protein SBOR_3768 [Sclerotinia borealis F-4128]|uniref:Altered inheritance of mitochondria protein 11 n=1 Tax=Sclerotinia borealis (strain F-4128) TaxID=1432307 RepID=W9CJ15_SCLBF|nr:hypothetical protein SBOR_3768 [Sclerotinia borealis F-4128]